jgi:L-ornithine N5-oxygenase
MAPHAETMTFPPEEHRPAVQDSFTGFSAPVLDVTTFPELENRSLLRHTPEDELHDLVCVGFGPASLAIAVALHDAIDGSDPNLQIPGLQAGRHPRVAFLEKQTQFRWHAGMLLPGARMQITFLKDMATLRNPRSEFTFLNYLFQKERLVEFANLNTFLPQRIEYEDYMKWCASWFSEVVSYGQEAVQVIPEKTPGGNGDMINTFIVVSKNLQTGQVETRRTKHVIVAAGGRPNLPAPFPANHPRVIHSSKFSYISTKLLQDLQKPYNIAVVGNGQSAAEIFDFLHTHYPNARTRMLIKGSALRPSDDSPL